MADTPDDAFRDAFIDLIGTDSIAETYNGGLAGGFDDWFDMYLSTGIDMPTQEDDIDAFSEFLLAFYPQDKTEEEWWLDREEFYNDYDITDNNIDWEAYRDAIDTPGGA